MNPIYPTSQNILYANSGLATKEQILKILVEALKELNKVLKNNNEKPLKCDFEINLVTKFDFEAKKAIPTGHTYIWITDSKVLNSFLGLNLDGSSRELVKKIENWERPEILNIFDDFFKDYLNTTKSPAMSPLKISWPDLCDAAEEEEKYIESLSSSSDLSEIGPLVTIPGYKYTKEQQEYIQLNENLPDIRVPKNGYIEVSRAVLYSYDDNISNELVATKVPGWVTTEMVRKLFEKFATDSSRRSFNSETKEMEFYPLVCFSKSWNNKRGGNTNVQQFRTVFVTFSPGSQDAKNALLMRRKVFCSLKNETCMLTFNHKSTDPQN